jgi:hypothetical protein
MHTYLIRWESGIMDCEIKATCFNTLARSINLKNATEILEDGAPFWRHPEGMPYEFGRYGRQAWV